MTTKELLQPTNVKLKLLSGVNTLVDTMKLTLGTKGQVILYNHKRDFDDSKGMATLTKDGFTVSKNIDSWDNVEKLAMQVVREASRKTVEASGDGTTSTAIVAQALIQNGHRLINEDKVMTAWEFKRHCDEACHDITKFIHSKSSPVDDQLQRIRQVATISSNDEEIGDLIYGIVKEIGAFGDIEPKQTFSYETSFEVVKGMKVNKGYIAPFMCNDLEKMTFEVDHCKVLLFDDVIRDYADIAEYIRASVDESGQPIPILIFVQDIASTVLTRLEGMMTYNRRPIMLVNHDGFGDRMIDIMNDISLFTGALIVDNSVDTSEAESFLGECKKVVVNQRTTCMYYGKSDEEAVAAECELLKQQINDPNVDRADKKFLRKRLANLGGGIAVINVGGATKVEMEEAYYRVEDAVLAVRAAIRDGVVPGGAYVWLSAWLTLSNENNHPAYQATLDSLLSIPKQLLINSETYSEETMLNLTEQAKNNRAYDLSTGQFYDLNDYNVYDATSVLVDTITNAAAVAKSILSVGRVIYDGTVYI